MPGAPSSFLFLVAMPGAPSSFLFLVAMPGAPSSFLFLVAMPGAPSSFLFLVAMPGAPSSFLFLICVYRVTLCLSALRPPAWRWWPWLLGALEQLGTWKNDCFKPISIQSTQKSFLLFFVGRGSPPRPYTCEDEEFRFERAS